MNITTPILRYGHTRPDAEALIDGERRITYRELMELVLRTAGHLTALGVTAQDRVGFILKDTADQFAILLATAWLGAVSVPLDWRARPSENERLIAAAGIKLVLIEPESQPSETAPTATVDEAWHRAVAQAKTGDGDLSDWRGLFMISASSGSTGAAKLTAMTHLHYYLGIVGMFEALDLAGRHHYLSTLPLCYGVARASCIAHLLRGDCVTLYPSLFDAGEYVEAVRSSGITVSRLVPATIRRLLLACGGTDPLLPELTALFCGGAPLYAEEKRQALIRLTPNFNQNYGTTETMIITVLRPEAIATRAGSVGQPLSMAEVEIVDDEDRPLPVGASGHLRYRGPSLASPLSGADSAFRGGWFYPGEIARMDELSYIFLEGRVSEVIVRSGGVKIQPAEVEQVLCEHPDVIEAAVIGRQNAEDEEEAVAFVVARREMASIELVAHCRSRLTAYKVPRQFHFLKQLPKNSAGKIDKLALAQRSMERG